MGTEFQMKSTHELEDQGGFCIDYKFFENLTFLSEDKLHAMNVGAEKPDLRQLNGNKNAEIVHCWVTPNDCYFVRIMIF